MGSDCKLARQHSRRWVATWLLLVMATELHSCLGRHPLHHCIVGWYHAPGLSLLCHLLPAKRCSICPSTCLSVLQCVGAIPFGSRLSRQASMQQAPSLIQVPSRGAMVKGHSISNAAVRRTGAVPGSLSQIAACFVVPVLTSKVQ